MGRFTRKMQKKAEEDYSKKREKQLAPVVKEIVKKILDADLPIENTMNEYEQCNVVAKDIIQILLDNDVVYTDRHFVFQLALTNEIQQFKNKYKGKVEYLDKNGEAKILTLTDDTVLGLVMRPFEVIKSIVITSLENNFNKAIDKLLKKDLLDFTVSDLDGVLKS